MNGRNIPLKYIDSLANILDVEKDVLMNNFDIKKIKNILNKIDKFKEDNPVLPISISKNYRYVFPVEIENILSVEEERYLKKNIKNHKRILDKIQ